MNEIIKIDQENDILILRHFYKNGWSEVFEYKLSEVINSISPSLPNKSLGQIEYYE